MTNDQLILETLAEIQQSIGQINVSLTRIEDKQAEHSDILNQHSGILKEHSDILNQHSGILKEHSDILNQHSDILKEHSEKLDEIFEILAEHSTALNTLIEWADDVQAIVKIPFAKTEKID